MSDSMTTVAELRGLMRKFVDERDWAQFHSPKNLSMALAIEAAELMEHFQWLTPEASIGIRDSAKDFQEVREELADILAFALSFANALDIDISTAVQEKLVKSAAKYPADEFRGRFR